MTSSNTKEKLCQIKQEIKKIGKNYNLNINNNYYHLNGDNHQCFTIEGEVIKFKAVGGSRFFYPDMSFEDFIKKLPTILLTNKECDEVYQGIANNLSN